jgi:PTS system ascorbate-specific IIA component
MHIMLITHFDLGAVLLRSAQEIVGKLPISTTLINVDNNTAPEIIRAQALELLKKTGLNEPILILTDLYGSTPHNIAESLESGHTIKVVSGVNLPMLLRVFNYHALPFEIIVSKAIEGAHNGIITAPAY